MIAAWDACGVDHNSREFDDIAEYALHLNVEHGACASVSDFIGRKVFCYLEAGHPDDEGHVRSKSGFDPNIPWR